MKPGMKPAHTIFEAKHLSQIRANRCANRTQLLSADQEELYETGMKPGMKPAQRFFVKRNNGSMPTRLPCLAGRKWKDTVADIFYDGHQLEEVDKANHPREKSRDVTWDSAASALRVDIAKASAA